MHLDNTNTAETHRFFMPDVGEVEHHESVDVTGTPQVEVVPGDQAYAITDNGEAHRVYDEPRVPSGSTIKRIATLDYGRGRYRHNITDLSEFDNAQGEYEIQEDDLLIVEANIFRQPRESKILGMVDREGIMLHPANQPLPFANGEGTGSEVESIDYTIVGAITRDLKLVSWPGSYSGGQNTARAIDLSVVSALIQNSLEHALLESKMGGGSLVGLFETIPGARAYLRYFDSVRGTAYTPTKDPIERGDEFPEALSKGEFDLWVHLAALATDRRSRQ